LDKDKIMPLLEVDGVKLNYQINGDGDPLLLIHGLGSSGRDWELQVEYFSQSYKVIRCDLRGHGKSSKPPGPYSIELFSKDCSGLLSRIGCSPAHILGISLGGMVAFQMGIDHPDDVRSLVVVNSTPDLVPRSMMDHIHTWQRLLIIQLMGMRKMGEVLGNRFFPKPEQSELKEIFIERWGENHRPSYLEAMKAAVGWSVYDQLGEIKAPTLVIGSDEDYFPTEYKEDYVKMLPRGRLEIVEDARHALPAEKPEEFNRLVHEYLTGLFL
jgi:pimeloyl-ACP methyl ester carboxylesterase